jgi:osmotically-inducible protein OsmY
MLRTDEDIKKDVVDQLYWDSRIDASRVSVKAREGAVSLSGTVQTPLAIRAARDDAWMIDGVVAVHNFLEVDYTAPVSPDAELESTVKKVLEWAPEIDQTNVEAKVASGSAGLEGTVTTFWQKQRIEELTMNVGGITRVDNRLCVVPTSSLADQAVAESIMSALDRNTDIDPTAVDVRVEDGTVSLSGKVPTWHARKAAYDAALFTDGVVNIHDDLTVDPIRG